MVLKWSLNALSLRNLSFRSLVLLKAPAPFRHVWRRCTANSVQHRISVVAFWPILFPISLKDILASRRPILSYLVQIFLIHDTRHPLAKHILLCCNFYITKYNIGVFEEGTKWVLFDSFQSLMKSHEDFFNENLLNYNKIFKIFEDIGV